MEYDPVKQKKDFKLIQRINPMKLILLRVLFYLALLLFSAGVNF